MMFSHFLRKLGSLAGRSTGETTTTGGLLWRLAPNAAAFFGPAGPDLAAWQAAGLTEPIKQNLQRTITRVHLPGGAVYVKRCRANTPRSWAREVLRPAKAQLEFDNALTLRARGITAIEPLAWGSASRLWPGESYLITRAEDDAIPFLDFLEAPLSPARRRQIADRVAVFLAALHEAGVTHPDPHPGNILIERDTLRFILADLHAIRFGRPLNWPESRANLTLLNRWFQVRSTRTDRLRFWFAYLRARHTWPADADRMAK
jgi:hypothetical protein